jgi:HlyD family secretion protein
MLSSPHAPIVDVLSVKEGDHVKHGELLATFAGRGELEAAYVAAKAQAEVANKQLDQLKAGAKTSDLAAQDAEIGRLTANLKDAQNELKRAEALAATNDVTASEVDSRRTAVQMAHQAVDEATDRRESMKVASPADISVAEAEVQVANANAQRAQKEYEMSAIYAPADGDVLKVHSHAGEEVGAEGLLDLGGTDNMTVVAEVYETDIGRVKVGEHATVTGDMLKSPLTGSVERIDQNVRKAAVLPGDTSSYSDNRIVEVRVRLDQREPAANLIDGKVTVVLQP